MMVSRADFQAALLDPAAPAPPGLSDAQGRAAMRRFDVYRNNVAASLTEALLTGFPVITRLLGEENMRGLAGIFLRRHPPDSPCMFLYGAGLAGFLEQMPQLSHLGYLGDVARLEFALRRSYHAADADPVPVSALAALPPDRLDGTAVTLAPALQVLRSGWPVLDIWRMNTDEKAPAPRAMAQDVCVLRPGYDPVPHALPPGGAAFVEALADGAPLVLAQEAGEAASPGFDPAPVLALLLQGRAITSLKEED